MAVESKADQTRRRILDAAAQIFRAQGYANARLTDIAELAGKKTGSIYYHFESREALVSEILHLGIEKAWTHVANTVEALPDEAEPMTRLEVAIRAHLEAVLDIGDYSAAQARIIGEVPPNVLKAHREEQRAYGNFLNGFFRAAGAGGFIRRDIDPLIAQTVMVGAGRWMTEWIPLHPRTSPADVIDQLVRILFTGFVAPDRSGVPEQPNAVEAASVAST